MFWTIIILLSFASLIIGGIVFVFKEMIASFSNGNIGFGLLYVFGIILVIVIIWLTIYLTNKYKKKREAQKQQEISAVNDLINKWTAIKKKADNNAYSAEDLFEHMTNVVKKLHFTDFQEETKSGLKIVRASNSENVRYVLMLLEEKTVDFDKLADIIETVNEELKTKAKVVFMDHSLQKGVYIKLMNKIFIGLGVYYYTNGSLSDDANAVISELRSEIEEIEKKYAPPTVTYQPTTKSQHRYRKIFPRVMSSKDDPDYLQALDDLIFMDIMNDDF